VTARIPVAIEATPKKTFATAVDWPGWSRSGRTVPAALDALLAYAPRYEPVARAAGEAFPISGLQADVLESVDGGSGTEFGVPSRVTEADRRPTSAADGDRLARFVGAAWKILDSVAAVAPEELRKGPRGGGRNRSRILAHVVESEWYYLKEMGVRVPQPAADDDATVAAVRAAILRVLRQSSDGSPLADRRWTVRYAAHRIAWHVLDHAWEMEDRSSRPDA
jgi:hypothetical protein